MKLTLQRMFLTDKSTCGELFIEGQVTRFCYTLELPVKDGLPRSAIPPGTYQIEMAPSPKFHLSQDPWVQQYADKMPHIINIPNRSLIMVHWGNEPENTDGCILVGLTHDLDVVSESRAAFEQLYPLLADGDTIDIQGGNPHQSTWPNE